ncbi:MAG: hypothetical protein KF884_10750 [Fimbriimonadaceae bacterium]|nr:hypothetical protein [Fimbriimonadaceae bacterium]QYK58025.1 MAG: hypothetical protein KF884_10750 [Fimbriimonadaceae bacterium]
MSDVDLALRAQSGDRDAEARFVARFWSIARLEARDFVIGRLALDDRHMVALAAVVAACRSWRPDRGANVSSYVKICVRRALIELARREGPQRLARRIESEAVPLDLELETDRSAALLAVQGRDLVLMSPDRILAQCGAVESYRQRLIASGATLEDAPRIDDLERFAAFANLYFDAVADGKTRMVKLDGAMLRAVRACARLLVDGCL